MRITFTLDVEDHRDDIATDPRHLASTREVLEFLGERGVRGTFFLVGDVVDEDPGLVRAIAADGHELAVHGHRHVALPELTADGFRPGIADVKARLEDLAQQPVVGYRAPMFSLVPSTRWALDVLAGLGFTYSASVLPIRHPLFGDPTCPAGAFRWPNGIVELPCPVLRRGRAGFPFLAGVWLRNLPWPAIRTGMQLLTDCTVAWTYAHPYDFDPDEPFRVLPEAGRVGSRLIWRRRSVMFDRVDRVLSGRSAPPLRERVASLPDDLPVLARMAA